MEDPHRGRGAEDTSQRSTERETQDDDGDVAAGNADLCERKAEYVRLHTSPHQGGDQVPGRGGRGTGRSSSQGEKVIITGFNVRAWLSVSDETRVMLLPYEPYEGEHNKLEQVPLETIPNARHGKVPEAFQTVKVPFQSLGLVSKDGPLMTKTFGDSIDFNTVDGGPYECRISTHAGKPIGPVVRKKFGLSSD